MRHFVIARSSTSIDQCGVRFWNGKGWGVKAKAKRYAHACNAKAVLTVHGFTNDLHTAFYVDTSKVVR